jgi:hypothetical protein
VRGRGSELRDVEFVVSKILTSPLRAIGQASQVHELPSRDASPPVRVRLPAGILASSTVATRRVSPCSIAPTVNILRSWSMPYSSEEPSRSLNGKGHRQSGSELYRPYEEKQNKGMARFPNNLLGNCIRIHRPPQDWVSRPARSVRRAQSVIRGAYFM